MKSKYDGSNHTVISSVEHANSVLANEDFYNRIADHAEFDYTEESPEDIAKWLKESGLTVTVRLYKGALGSKTTAYVSDKYPDTLFLNSRKLDRNISEIINTIIHECVHSVDGSLQNARFGHGNNSASGKGNSAPYWIGNLAERIFNGQKSRQDKSFVDDSVVFIEESEEIDESLIINE